MKFSLEFIHPSADRHVPSGVPPVLRELSGEMTRAPGERTACPGGRQCEFLREAQAARKTGWAGIDREGFLEEVTYEGDGSERGPNVSVIWLVWSEKGPQGTWRVASCTRP